MTVRTRFAPSPTGYLHVGGVRTALFAWLVARQAGGEFILRLEDTDQKREVAGADQHIIDSLQTLGLNWDEGPFYQSKRLDVYKTWAQKLIDSGRAYADPYTPEEVEAFRQQAQAAKRPFLFRNHRPENPPAWDGSQPLRLKSDPKPYHWHDEVMGDLSTGPEAIDDFVLIKSDGYPTYNFAHIVDDAEMKVSHVIRSQEFIASVPNYLNLYEALELKPPIMAIVPPILGPSGNKKLSKRDGAKDVLDYIRGGYLPEALINFIASLGWNDGTEQEIFTIHELIDKFKLERVQKAGARFDERRLLWMNGQHIARLSTNDLYKRLQNFWPSEAASADEAYRQKVVELAKQRLRTLAELADLTRFFFADPSADKVAELFDQSNIDEPTRNKMLKAAIDSLTQSDFSEEDIKSRLNNLLTELDTKPAILFSTIRIAISGAPHSPELFGSLAVLGKETSLARLNSALTA